LLITTTKNLALEEKMSARQTHVKPRDENGMLTKEMIQ